MFEPSANETILVAQILAQLGTKKVQNDKVAWKDVEQILQGANLSSTVLWRIFNAANFSEPDKDRLTRESLAIVVRMVGWAQNGVSVSRALLHKCKSAVATYETCALMQTIVQAGRPLSSLACRSWDSLASSRIRNDHHQQLLILLLMPVLMLISNLVVQIIIPRLVWRNARGTWMNSTRMGPSMGAWMVCFLGNHNYFHVQ
jgi:hypothetical protein